MQYENVKAARMLKLLKASYTFYVLNPKLVYEALCIRNGSYKLCS